MGRIIGIDYGTKRTGIAVTDPLQIIASPFDTVRTHDLFDFLKKYLETEEVDGFAVGMPKKTDNTPSENAMHVVGFLRRLKKLYPEKIIEEVDERFTSRIAQDALLRSGVRKKERQNKSNTDKVSAALILQTYMESRSYR